MSLLEDVFLEDEANEAQELERIIEGDGYDDNRPEHQENSDENSEKEDEAEEDKRRVDPAAKVKRVVKNPRFTLNPARLTGPRGIQVLPDHFKDFKFKGKGHEKEDLDLVLKKLEHWAYRLYPKFKFEDCLKKIETLGKKRPVMVHLTKIRSDQFLSDETVVQKDSSEDEAAPAPEEDEFDKLLSQQIQLARAAETPVADKRMSHMMPKATSSPSISDEQKERMLRNRKLAEERRLARLKAQYSNNNEVDLTVIHDRNSNKKGSSINLSNIEEGQDNSIDLTGINNLDSYNDRQTTNIDKGSNRFDTVDMTIDSTNTGLVRKNKSNVLDSSDEDDLSRMNKVDEVIDITKGYQGKRIDSGEIIELDDEIVKANHNRLNVIDSSDDDNDDLVINEAVTVDVHKNVEQRDDQMAVEQRNVNFGDNIDENEKRSEEFTKNPETDEIAADDVSNDSYNEQNKDMKAANSELTNTFDALREIHEDSVATNESEQQDTEIGTVNQSCDKKKVVLIDSENTETQDSQNTDIGSKSKDKLDIIKGIESLKSNANADKRNEENHVTNSEVLDDLMDVDFSDDF